MKKYNKWIFNNFKNVVFYLILIVSGYFCGIYNKL